jgi:hypothetical protein
MRLLVQECWQGPPAAPRGGDGLRKPGSSKTQGLPLTVTTMLWSHPSIVRDSVSQRVNCMFHVFYHN